MSGQTALLVSGTNFLNTIRDNAPEVYKNLGIYKQLSGTNGKTDFSMMNLIIPKKSKNPKEAIDFALFLTNEKNQLDFAKLAPVFPSNKAALENQYFSQQENNLEQKIRFIGAQSLKNSVNPIKIQKNHALLNELVDSMTQKVLLNKLSSEEALNEIKTELGKY